MSLFGSRFGRVAAGALVAGAFAVGGAGIANAEEAAPEENIEIVYTPGEDGTGEAPSEGGSSESGDNWTPPPAPGPGEVPPSDIEDPEPTPEPEPEPEPTTPEAPPAEEEEAKAPGKSGDHRASTPQQALDNHQSHKQGKHIHKFN